MDHDFEKPRPVSDPLNVVWAKLERYKYDWRSMTIVQIDQALYRIRQLENQEHADPARVAL